MKKKYSFLRLCLAAFTFWNSLTFIGIINGFQVITILIIGTALTDIIAFLVGKRYGKFYLSKLSPQKTWEGLISGICLGAGLSCAIIWIFNMKIVFYQHTTHFLVLIFSYPVILALSAIGDLFFSKQKRIFEVKDFSKLLGVSGGFWDRFDSHTFSLGSIFLLNIVMNLFVI